MKILVAVKRVVDAYIKIRVKSDQSGVETQNVKMSINPFDEIALEEALRWREKNLANEVIVVSIGNDASQETLRHALALGADRAILVKSNQTHCSLHIAKILKAISEQEHPDLILLGKQAIDSDNNQTAQMLAALLDWPQATFASEMLFAEHRLTVTREIDGGLETLSMSLPAVVSVDLRLNEPRYASLPNIMKAKNKRMDVIELPSLGIPLREHQQLISVKAPANRSGGVMLNSVKSLVDKLQLDVRR
jgi:electron transfer flavoprotein beta subunit